MKIKPIKKEYMKVLERIQNSIPKELTDNVTSKVQKAPKQAKLYRDIAAGIDNPDIDNTRITPKIKEFAQAIIDSGEIKRFEEEITIENKEVTFKINKFIEEEIEKAVKRGELPKGKKFRNLNKKVKWKK